MVCFELSIGPCTTESTTECYSTLDQWELKLYCDYTAENKRQLYDNRKLWEVA